jgi:hypothetical protein
LDAGAQSFGSNIFLPNVPPYRIGDYGYKIGSGTEANTIYASLLLSYELKENLFIEVSGAYRNSDVPSNPSMSEKTTIISAGIRWNVHRREFEF